MNGAILTEKLRLHPPGIGSVGKKIFNELVTHKLMYDATGEKLRTLRNAVYLPSLPYSIGTSIRMTGSEFGLKI